MNRSAHNYLSNLTTPFPLKNNCTENIMQNFHRLRNIINIFKSKSSDSSHQHRPIRPIDPFCIVPDKQLNYTFMPDFYCPTMVHNLYCNKTEELQYLHKFYHDLNGDNWNKSTYWLHNSTDYCKWYGIYCCNTSYPLYQTCINVIHLKGNNLFGTLPSPWPNSSVLTIFGVTHNHISGTIPDYHDRLPNLSVFELKPIGIDHPNTDSVTGQLPNWPSAGCMVYFNVENNLYLHGSLPDWNKPLKYIVEIELSTSLSGTLPSWTEWLWPNQLTICSLRNITGTISPFTNAKCPTLDRLYLWSNDLSGTVPPLPPQVHAGARIYLHNNKFTGEFPWHSLNNAKRLTLQDNQFRGEIKLRKGYKHFLAINISNNHFDGMFPCLMDNHELKYVDARFNKFDSIATDHEDDCIAWPESLSYLLLSNNEINAKLDTAVTNLTNLTMIDFGNNRFKGTVPSTLVEGMYNGMYVSFYDNDFSCTFPYAGGRQFNDSWIYIGNVMKKPWAPYTNEYEKGLGIIAIQPNDEARNYMIMPLIIGASLFVFYGVWIYLSAAPQSKLWIRLKQENNDYVAQTTQIKMLYIMQHGIKFIGILSLIAILMMIIYTLGANFYQCGYVSLQPTITYLGTMNGDGYDIYSFISIGLFCLYSLLCTWFVVKLMYLANYFAKSPNSIPNTIQDQYTSNDPNKYRRLLKTSSISTTINNSNKIITDDNSAEFSLNKSHSKHCNDYLKESLNTSNEAVSEEIKCETCSTCCKCCKCVWWTMKFSSFLTGFTILLFGPIIAYNIYHSIPYTHIRYIPEINTQSVQNFIIYVVPFLLAIAKFFGIPYANDKIRKLLIEVGIVDRHSHNIWRNFTLCIIRFITMIILPITILLIFDDGCLQKWKSLWDYCDKYDNGDFIHPQCEKTSFIQPHFSYPSQQWLCHAVCEKMFVPYRCIRRFFEVLGPLFIYKMNIALWFPLIYSLQQSQFGKYVMKQSSIYWKRIKACCCCARCKKNGSKSGGGNGDSEKIKMDIQYMSLISSLEIVIVFGWAIPILVILYGITIFGYWCIYSYWFNNSGEFMNRKPIKPVSKWLILSLMLQHTFSCLFYWYTQSIIHGVICIIILLINIICFFVWSLQYENK